MSFSQNWDGVTPPAIPSGWTVDSVFTTATTPLSGGLSPTSSPNVLAMTPASTNTIYYASFGTQDGNSGNVATQVNFAVTAVGTHCRCGVMARGSAYPLSGGSTSFYRALMGWDTGLISAQRVNSGSFNALATVSTSALATDTWYTLYMTVNSSSSVQITISVQRVSDGYWMNASGTFQSASASVMVVTDNSPLTGQGYSGLTVEQNSGSSNPVYSDDWSLAPLAPPSPIPSVFVVPSFRYALDLRPGNSRP